jgi:hypothetical protein
VDRRQVVLRETETADRGKGRTQLVVVCTINKKLRYKAPLCVPGILIVGEGSCGTTLEVWKGRRSIESQPCRLKKNVVNEIDDVICG